MEKLRNFIRENSLSILVTLGVIGFILFVFFKLSPDFFEIPAWLAFTIFGYQRENQPAIDEYVAKHKGITEQDARNIIFVKTWDETRRDGLWRYCIKDGGFIRGAWIGIGIGFLFGFSFQSIMAKIIAEPGDMFKFIGCCYLAGIIIGAVAYRILWIFNERKFIRLTDPLNSPEIQKAWAEEA